MRLIKMVALIAYILTSSSLATFSTCKFEAIDLLYLKGIVHQYINADNRKRMGVYFVVH